MFVCFAENTILNVVCTTYTILTINPYHHQNNAPFIIFRNIVQNNIIVGTGKARINMNTLLKL